MFQAASQVSSRRHDEHRSGADAAPLCVWVVCRLHVMPSPIRVPRRPLDRLAARLALCSLLVALIAALTFRDYGLGWDDYTHSQYGELLLALYASGFKDTRALSFVNLYLYGGGFDMAAALLAKILPFDLFETRRLARRRGRHHRPRGDMAHRAPDRRPARRAARARAARGLPALLRPHVHQPEGRAVRGGDGGVPARAGARARGISEARRGHAARSSALGFGLSIGSRIMAGFGVLTALGAFALLVARRSTRAGRARRGLRASAACLLRAAARRDPRLRGDGADLAVGRDRSAQSDPRHRRVLAFLREAVAGAVRGRAADAARDAAPLRAGAARRCKLPEIFWLLGLAGVAGALVIGVPARARRHSAARDLSCCRACRAPAGRRSPSSRVRRCTTASGTFIFILPPLAVAAGLAADWVYRRATQPRVAHRGGGAWWLSGCLLAIVQMVRLHPYQYVHFNLIAGGAARRARRASCSTTGACR